MENDLKFPFPALYCRVHTGHGKPGKSWNFRFSFSRPEKSLNLSVGHGKSWKIINAPS